MPPGETEPAPPRTEGQILAVFGYDHCSDIPLMNPDGAAILGQDGAAVIGGRFLDVYTDPEKRQHTQDMLDGFLDMDPADPDYADAQAFIASYLGVYFGQPKPGTG